jgi:Zn-dependent protease with chaperone function
MARNLAGTEYGETAAEQAKLLQWESEFEADRRGVSYALQQGHSAAEVRAGVQKFFGITGADPSDTHPGDDSRLQRIDAALEASVR